MTTCHLCGKEIEDGRTISNCVEICDDCHEENLPAIRKGYFDWEDFVTEVVYEKNLEKLLSVYA